MEQNVIQINGGIMINCGCDCKKCHVCEKDYVWNPATCNCENGKYLTSIMDDSVIECDKIIYTEKTNFNEKNITSKTKFLYFTYIFIIYYSIIDSC